MFNCSYNRVKHFRTEETLKHMCFKSEDVLPSSNTFKGSSIYSMITGKSPPKLLKEQETLLVEKSNQLNLIMDLHAYFANYCDAEGCPDYVMTIDDTTYKSNDVFLLFVYYLLSKDMDIPTVKPAHWNLDDPPSINNYYHEQSNFSNIQDLERFVWELQTNGHMSIDYSKESTEVWKCVDLIKKCKTIEAYDLKYMLNG